MTEQMPSDSTGSSGSQAGSGAWRASIPVQGEGSGQPRVGTAAFVSPGALFPLAPGSGGFVLGEPLTVAEDPH